VDARFWKLKTLCPIPRHRRHSVIIVPTDTPGTKIKSPITTFGYDDAPFGHFEVDFTDVIVPQSNLLKEEGAGFGECENRFIKFLTY